MDIRCTVCICLTIFSHFSVTGCGASKVTLGAEMETFLMMSLNYTFRDAVFVESIQEDEYNRGNILAAIGSGIFTIDMNGKATLLTGSLQEKGYKDAVGTEARFNRTSGMVQVYDGMEIIISDFSNNCIRKFNRQNGLVTTLAGTCNANDCPTRGRIDGPAQFSAFCHPTRLRYIKSKHHIVVLDLSLGMTTIRTVDLLSSRVNTIFISRKFASYDFMASDDEEHYLFPETPGILRVNNLTGEGAWLAGCGRTSLGESCAANSTVSQVSMETPQVFEKYNNVYLVGDFTSHDVYIIDLQNDEYTRICDASNAIERCYAFQALALAVVDDYLYIGESLRPNFFIQELHIKRIRLSISTTYDASSGENWLKISEKYPTTTQELTTTRSATSNTVRNTSPVNYQSQTLRSFATHSSSLTIAAIVIGCLALFISCSILIVALWCNRNKVASLKLAFQESFPISTKVAHKKMENTPTIHLHVNNNDNHVSINDGGGSSSNDQGRTDMVEQNGFDNPMAQ